MTQLRVSTALAVAVLLVASAVGASEVRMSTATAPSESLSERLSSVSETERGALGSLSRGRLSALTRREGDVGASRRGLAALFGDSREPDQIDDPAESFAYTAEALAAVPAREGGSEWRCLAEALYFEARGESVEGQFAVAETILNRVDAPQFPATVCSVVHQGTGERHRCQFTFACDGVPETIGNPTAFRDVGKVAALMLDGLPRRLTDGATYFHTPQVSPRWARRMERTATIGSHHFYRPPLEVSRN